MQSLVLGLVKEVCTSMKSSTQAGILCITVKTFYWYTVYYCKDIHPQVHVTGGLVYNRETGRKLDQLCMKWCHAYNRGSLLYQILLLAGQSNKADL